MTAGDPIPAELRCIARIAAAAAGGPQVDGIGALDPRRLAGLARRHRLAAPALELLATHCRARDPAIADRLTARARDKRLNAVLLTGHVASISAALTAAGIRHLAIKGPALARQIFGDPVARDSKDVDFLIDPAALHAAAAVVRALGFRDGEGLPGGKDRTFLRSGVELELHSRLVDIPALLPVGFDALWDTRETVTLGSTGVPVPGLAHAIVYLCVHGAEHLWFRLRWVQDIARIAVAGPPGAIDDAMALAGRLRLERVVSAGLQLVERVCGVPVPGAPPPDVATARLVALSEAALVLPAEVASRPPLGWLLRKLPVQFALRRDWGYRRARLADLLFAPRSFDLKPWPRWARWAYQPLRPFVLLHSRLAGRRGGGPDHGD